MKPKYQAFPNLALIVVASAAAGLSPLATQSASAAAYWNGVTAGDWNTGTNWSGSAVPVSSDDLTILGPGNVAGTLAIDLSADAFANSINFTDPSAVSLTNTTSASDRTLNLANGLTSDSGAVTIGSATANQGVKIALGASQIWNIGSGGLTAANIISGTGFGITKTGSGTLTLNGANTYSGGTTLSAGTLLFGSAAGAGTGTITLSGGTFGASGAQTITNAVLAAASTTTTLQGTGTLTLNGILSGSGTLNVGSSGVSLGNTAINASNASRSGGFTGALSVGGVLGFNSPASVNGADYYYNLSNAAVTLATGGSTQFNAANGGATNNPGVLYVNLGSLSSASGVGTIGAVNGGTAGTKASRYVVGTLNTDTIFGGVIAAASAGTSLTKVGTGTLTLTGANTYTGATYGTFSMPATTIRGGTLQVGDGTSGSLAGTGALTFLDSGRFNYQGQAAGSSQSLGALTFAQGAGTVQSTYGSSGNTSLTFASLAARAAGATGNFVVSGGSNGSTNKIVFTAAPTSDFLIDKGIYFGGGDFAAYDSGGYLRALAYGTDGVTSAVDTIATVTHVKLSSTPAAQDDTSLLTLNLAGSGVSWSNNDLQTLTLSGGGLIKSGGGTVATIGGGTGLTTGGATELVVRTDASSDSLDIQTPILGTSTGGLTKSGTGTLTLSATGNAYTGVTRLNEGTLALSGTYTGGGQFIVNNSGTLTVTGSLTSTAAGQSVIVGNGSGNGILNVNSGSTLTLGFASGNNVGLSISNSGTGYDTGSGTVNVNGGTINTNQDIAVGLGGCQTGTLNLNSGTINIGTGVLRWFKIGQFDTANGVVNMDGGDLNLSNNSDIRYSANSGSGNSVFNQNAGNVISHSGNGTGTAGSATDGLIDMQQGAGSLATNTYNLNGGTLTINAIISAQTTATRIFSFNGGTLKAASALNAANFLNLGAGNTRANVRNGGALIHTNGFNVTVAQALLHSNVSGDNATDGGLTKDGTGILTLGGVNAYTGATTIASGTLALSGTGNIDTSSSVTIGAGAKLATTAKTGTYTLTASQSIVFGLDAAGAGSSGQIDAADLNISAADVSFSITGTLDDAEYILANYSGTLTGTFTDSAPAGYTFDYGTGTNSQIKLVPAGAGYSAWAALNGASANPDEDHDNDGMDNGIEYFIGGPGGNTTGITVNPGPDGTKTVTWVNGAALPTGDYGTEYVVQKSTDLVNWTPVPDNGSDSNLVVTAGSVKYTINGAGKQFVRLKVTPD